LELAKFDGISFLFFLAKFELFVTNSMYLHLAWSTFLIVLSFHQLAIMTVLFSMLATGRTYQQTIQTEKYIHMYKIVKNKEEKYVNKEIKIF
jgi:threonine/homoserine/homoserine lactone efflux protein